MALSYTVDQEKKQVVITGLDNVPMPAMIDVVDHVAEDPLFKSEFTVLFDLREASYTPELRDGDEFADALRRRKDDFLGRFAVVVPDSLHFLARLYCLLASAAGFDRMRCFTDMAEAESWCRHP